MSIKLVEFGCMSVDQPLLVYINPKHVTMVVPASDTDYTEIFMVNDENTAAVVAGKIWDVVRKLESA